MNLGGNDVEVKFGGQTSDLDRASRKAKEDIAGVGQTAAGLRGVLSNVKTAFLNSFNMENVRHARGELAAMTGTTEALKMGMQALNPELLGVGVALATVFAVKEIVEFGERMGDLSLKLDQTAQKLGITVKEASQWQSVSTMMNMGSDAMTGSLTRLERAMVLASNGGKKQAAVFKELGINLKEIKDPTEAVLQIADKFKDMDNGPKKIAMAMALMGRSGAQLIPVLNRGREAILEMFKESDEMGATMSKDLVAQGLAIHESMDRVKLGMTGLRNVMFEELAPTIKAVSDYFGDLIKQFIESYKRGGAAKHMLEDIVFVLKILINVLAMVVEAFISFGKTAYHSVMMVQAPIEGLAHALEDIAHGDFGKAGTDSWKGFADAAEHAKGAVNGVVSSVKSFGRFSRNLWSPIKTGSGSIEATPDDMDLSMPGGAGKKKKAKRDDSEMQAWIEAQDFKIDMARDNADEMIMLEAKKVAKIGEYYGLDSREYQRALRDQLRMQRDVDQQKVRLNEDVIEETTANMASALQTRRAMAQSDFEEYKSRLDDEVEAGKMSNTQRAHALRQMLNDQYAAEVQFESDMHSLRMDAFEDELSIANLTAQERRRIMAEREKEEEQFHDKVILMERQHANEQKRSAQEVTKALQQKWQNVLTPITQTMQGLFQNMIIHTQTWKDAMFQAFQSLVGSFVQMGFDMLTHWASVELAKTTATTAGVAIRTSAEVAGNTTATASSAMHTLIQIGHAAALAAARVYAAIASIPVVGPFLAPAMAVAALGAVLYFGAKIASAKDGFDVPRGVNPVTQLHEEEMVLPASFANPLRALLSGAGPRNGGGMGTISSSAAESVRSNTAIHGGTTFNYQPSHTNGHDVSLEHLLKKEGAAFRKWVQNEFRNGRLSFATNG